MSNIDIVRALLDSYVAQDRETAQRLVAEDFVFTSPQDDHLDRATFFEVCFPANTVLETQRVLDIVPAGSDAVFVRYEYDSLQDGRRYRNAEYLVVRDGQVVETQVYFGGPV